MYVLQILGIIACVTGLFAGGIWLIGFMLGYEANICRAGPIKEASFSEYLEEGEKRNSAMPLILLKLWCAITYQGAIAATRFVNQRSKP